MAAACYPQFCALARAAEVIGERWTLLVVRELLLGPRRFSDLRARLDGISSSVLTGRLARMEAVGLVCRSVLPPPAASTVYELTGDGRALQPAVFELIRWGGRFLFPARPGERIEPEWMRLALAACARRGASPSRSVLVLVRDGAKEAAVHVAGGPGGTVVTDRLAPADVTVVAPFRTVLALVSGVVDPVAALDEGRIEATGDRSALTDLPRLFEVTGLEERGRRRPGRPGASRSSEVGPMAGRRYFGPELFDFLRGLRRNNTRDWFLANRQRYEAEARDPMLRFIADFGPHLREISRRFLADPRPAGGSLFRINRDTRFSKDKSPYKTMIAAHFRHEEGRDVHAPGFYLHLEPGQVFAGAGLWHPDSGTLARVREAIAGHPDRWKRAVSGKTFERTLERWGESLARPPRGYDPEHPFIEDLKRKDFVVVASLEERVACAPDFMGRVAAIYQAAAPFVEFLTKAVGLRW